MRCCKKVAILRPYAIDVKAAAGRRIGYRLRVHYRPALAASRGQPWRPGLSTPSASPSRLT